MSNNIHWLNTICPYYTMFPLDYPLSVLEPLTQQGQNANIRVLDPFCGRGTTLYAARMLGMSAYGVDTNPVAAAIAQAKLCSTTTTEVTRLTEELLAGPDPQDVPEGDFWSLCYSPGTLKSICKLREGLQALNSSAAILLRALILGILHGPIRRGLPSYLSNQMPRSFASKPDYSVRYWRAKALTTPPAVDVLDVVTRKVGRVLSLIPPSIRGEVQCADARELPFDGPFDVVITSPPYYGMNLYRPDQWLRFWFLGGRPEVPYTDETQVSRGGREGFTQALAEVWGQIANVSRQGTQLCIRFGSLPSAPVEAEELLRETLELSGHPWGVTQVQQVPQLMRRTRQAVQMGARAGRNSAVQEIDITAVLN